MLSTASDASALGVTAFLIIVPLTLIGGCLVFVRLWPWRNMFYSAWLAAVVLAVALPIAIPALIWPPAYFDDAGDSADCSSIAKDYAAEYTHPIATLWPLSVHVNECIGGGLAESGFRYDVDVKARGPYGIGFASSHITNSGGDSLDPSGGQVVGLLALTAGVLVVSIPFFVVLLQRHFRAMRPASVS